MPIYMRIILDTHTHTHTCIYVHRQPNLLAMLFSIQIILSVPEAFNVHLEHNTTWHTKEAIKLHTAVNHRLQLPTIMTIKRRRNINKGSIAFLCQDNVSVCGKADLCPVWEWSMLDSKERWFTVLEHHPIPKASSVQDFGTRL